MDHEMDREKDTVRPEYTKKQEGGDHYKRFVIQPIEFNVVNKIKFAEGCVVKYITTHHLREDGGMDLKKAIHYIEAIMENEYPEDFKSMMNERHDT